MSAAEEEFAVHLRAHKIPFEREYMFAKSIGRKWRADFFIEPDILVEINGGVFMKGGAHSLPTNIIRDYEKANAAQLLGFRLFKFAPKQHVSTGIAIETITKALAEPDEVRVR